MAPTSSGAYVASRINGVNAKAHSELQRWGRMNSTPTHDGLWPNGASAKARSSRIGDDGLRPDVAGEGQDPLQEESQRDDAAGSATIGE